MDFFKLERHEGGALLAFLDNPDDRVNMLSERMLLELEELLDQVETDHFAKALFFISAKEDNFIVGADIREFEKISGAEEAAEKLNRLHALFNRISNLSYPVIAAINGPCLGGGLELALACHFRIATDSPKTILGLPEIKLGLFPGGGGTQRLTRLIGIRKALPIMLTGRALSAGEAKSLGLVDLVVYPGDLPDTVKRCAPLLSKRFPRKFSYPPIYSLDWLLNKAAPAKNLYFKEVHRRITNRTGVDFAAPHRLVDCVEAGLGGTISDGFKAEEEAFGPLVLSPESEALRSLFFLQTALKKRRYGAEARPMDLIGVLGGGFMGSGIAVVSAQGGLRVAMKDVSQENLSKSLGSIWKHFDRRVRRRRGNPVERDRLYSLVAPTLDYHSFAGAGLVIEAVFEDLALKQQVIKEVEEHTSPECIYASNTSAIPIGRIAEASKRPENVIGMHYFSPVAKMPLLEIVATDRCADWVLETAVAVGRRQGKTVIVVKDGPGFYTTRILMPFMLEAIRFIEEGVPVRQVDAALRKFGFPVGPLKLIDEVGIDVAAHVAGELAEFFAGRGIHPPAGLDALLKAGFAGKKRGLGFYDYSPGILNRLSLPGFEPARSVNKRIYNFFGGAKRKGIDPLGIWRRPVFLMFNEAAMCLEEGILSSPQDGDIGAVFGLGFPPFLGGPFRHMDALGVKQIVTGLEDLAVKIGPRFEPAPILVRMAAHNEKFYNNSR